MTRKTSRRTPKRPPNPEARALRSGAYRATRISDKKRETSRNWCRDKPRYRRVLAA
ncbi:hypothetical protein [Cucumibacter marinus]|uniref:hypothetical protein n=1 Tax=Cucumibacter marinus TaxID=1121252 RepID=UPI000410000B|nr:hypothetical protein [Cucumibacter marinus]